MILSALVAGTIAIAQRSDTTLRAIVMHGDSAALATVARDRPADARDLLGKLIEEASRSRLSADSALPLARRLATAYTQSWSDSFPVLNLQWFERLSVAQRAAKRAADSLRLAGNRASKRDQTSTAIRLWRQAYRRSAVIPDSAAMAAALGNIGAGLYDLSRLDSAESYLTRAQQLALHMGDRRTALNALGVLGNVAMDRGELRRAEETIRGALAMRSTIGDVRGVAADHTNLGNIAAELDDATSARAHYTDALTLSRAHALDEPAAIALLNLANLATEQGRYAEADAKYVEALALFRKLENDADAALTLHNHGLLALRRGDYRKAKERLSQAVRIFTESGTPEDLIRVRRDLASLDAAMGDLGSASLQLRRADALRMESLPEDVGLAGDVALARGDLAAFMNAYSAADEQYGLAHMLYRRARDAAGEAEAQQGRATLLVERKQFGPALQLLEAAGRLQRANGDRRSAAVTDLMIGHTLRTQGNLVGARQALQRALDSVRVLNDVGAESAALLAFGDVELDARAPLAAEGYYRRALALLEARNAPTIAWQAYFGLGRALRARGAMSEAAVELRKSVAEVERMAASLPLAERRAGYLTDKWQAFAELALAERALADASAAFVTSERMRARQMLDAMARGRVAPAADDTTLRSRRQDLLFRIGELTQRLESEDLGVRTLRGPGIAATSSGVTREALAQAQEEYAQLLLESRADAGSEDPLAGAPSEWRAVSARLAADQVMLAYLVSDSTTMVFVVTRDTMRVLDLNVSRSTLASRVDFARGTLSRREAGRSAPWRTPLSWLHQRLIAPLELAGLLAGARRLVIVPHAELHYLPFAALIRRGARDEFLVERYDISYAPSATAWLKLGERGATAGNRVLAFAPRPDRLPGSREEVDAIRALYGADATVLTGSAASEKVFRSTAGSYDVVHLATYGVLNQHNPLFSFVELAGGGADDGRVEVHEVSGMMLRARLLVLSACQTGLASGTVSDVPGGDDWVGLVRAFLVAGASNVIATLWAVEDRSTAVVMRRLHERLRAGDSEVVALSRAQRETLRNPATSSPFYWAGFILVGGH